MKTIFETPLQVATARTGKKKYWQGRVLVDGDQTYTQASWWQEGSVVQHSVPAEVKAKNIGRANETDPIDQAKAEILSEMKRRCDTRGYRPEGAAPEKNAVLLPMLASKLADCEPEWPALAQPKFDGHRAVFDGTRFTTRGGQLHAAHIQAMAFDSKGLVLDGELMLAPDCPAAAGKTKVERFQLSARAVKKDYPELTPWIRFFVYDCVTDEPFPARYKRYQALAKGLLNTILIPVTATEITETEVPKQFKAMLAAGYEGLMLRTGSEGYQVGHRSRQLLKVKQHDDAEFKIADIVPAGKGKAATVGKFVCLTTDGVEFHANPVGSLEHRQHFLKERSKYIGKMVTVHYEGMSPEGRPRFPRAIGIRESWDV